MHTKSKDHKKVRDKSCKCAHCPAVFLAADPKASCCKNCAVETVVKCACHCGNNITLQMWRFKATGGVAFKNNHNNRGKSYKEIYGTESPGCGFKRGKDNPSNNLNVKEKISKALLGRCVWKENKTSDEIHAIQQKMLAGMTNSKYRKKCKDSKGKLYRSSLEVAVAEIFHAFNIPFKYEYSLKLGPKRNCFPDFSIFQNPFIDELNEQVTGQVQRESIFPSAIIEISGCAFTEWRDEFITKIKTIKEVYPLLPVIVVTYPEVTPYLRELAQLPSVTIFGLEDGKPRKINQVKSLIIESDHFNFDYSHFLPWHTGKCADFHGHSSTISVAVTGLVDDKGMLIDFSEVKKVVKQVVDCIDHKVFVPDYALNKVKEGTAYISFTSKNRQHKLEIPETEVVVIRGGDSTVETISEIIAGRILDEMPWNVEAVSVCVNEGIGKAAISTVKQISRSINNSYIASNEKGKFFQVLSFYRNFGRDMQRAEE